MIITEPLPTEKLPVQVYADMLRVSPETAKTVVAHARNQYRYKALADLWGVVDFVPVVESGPRLNLVDEQRILPDSPAVNRLSRYCLRFMTDRLNTMERMCADYQYVPDRELVRLFTVKVWAMTCHRFKSTASTTDLTSAEAQIAKEMSAVFANWSIRLMEINTNRANVKAPALYRFMNSMYPLYVERPPA